MQGLLWCEAVGIGYYPVDPKSTPYDEDYFAKYQVMEVTPLGDALVASRLALVRGRMSPADVIDIGIGSGAFVRAADCEGYDINPCAVSWLRENAKWHDPYDGDKVRAVCCWDSLEHIQIPSVLLNQVSEYVFLSIPIFRDADHVLRSKHFRKDEHYWYFTDLGLKRFMKYHGFDCVEQNAMETVLGREDIGSYVFRRKA
jgi:hypothetical protein